MDANILIQRLQQGEIASKVSANGETHWEQRPPTSTALQAARTIQQLISINDTNMRVIHQLNHDIESLHEQIQLLQSNKSSRADSQQSGAEFSQ